MAFDEQINNRIRQALAHLPDVEEKYMFGGSCFMVNGKMCIGVIKDKMMCRVGPGKYEEALEKNGCEEMDFTTRPMIGYVYVAADGMKSQKDFEYWIELCLAFNKEAKPAKKKKK